ncbi:MAG: prepilin peptidase [Oscillospiraceae bacterium]
MIKTAAVCVMLVYGAVIDCKCRKIPDIVPIVIIMCGVSLDLKVVWGIVCLSITAVSFGLVSKLTKAEIPGGDFKLLCALSFTLGLVETTSILALAAIAVLIVSLIRHKSPKDKVPLCTYIAPAYAAFNLALWGVMAMQ